MYAMTSIPAYEIKLEVIIAPGLRGNKLEIAHVGLSGLFGLSGSTK
jgi:hypothetical protein